jgi:DNA repair protein RecO (recombination protein O)
MTYVESDATSLNDGERRARLVRSRAIVLRRRDLGETDRILTVLSDRRGLIRLVAKGVRRPGSRLAGHLEPFSVSNVLIAKTRGLDIVTQAETVDAFGTLRVTEASIATAGYFAELVDLLLPEEQPHEGVFDLMRASLNLLDEGSDRKMVSFVFEMGLLRSLGYRPRLDPCLICGMMLTPARNGFSVEGGVVCANCLQSRAECYPLSVNALKLLRMIDRGEIERVLHLRVSAEVVREISDVLNAYVSRISGREPAALRVIRELQLE